jgi:S1-C subfamily serine protease
VNRIVVSSKEVASVAEALPAPLASPKLQSPLPKVPCILLALLVVALPALSLATIGVWLAIRQKEPRVKNAWIQYCWLLLVISALGSSAIGALLILARDTPPPSPSVPFALDSPAKLPQAPSGELLTASELAKRVEGAVFIVTRDNKWLKPTRQTLALDGFGAGALLFAGETGYLVATSRHVLDGAKWEHSSPFGGDALIWDREGGSSVAEIVGRHKTLDIMLLFVPRPAAKSSFVQPIVDFDAIAPGERIMVFGHPDGLFFSLSDGLVSRKDPTGIVQITAPVSSGASGGPVYDLRGQLLAIVSSMVDKRLQPNSENLNFAVRADCFLHPEQWQLTPSGKTELDRFAATEKRPATLPSH